MKVGGGEGKNKEHVACQAAGVPVGVGKPSPHPLACPSVAGWAPGGWPPPRRQPGREPPRADFRAAPVQAASPGRRVGWVVTRAEGGGRRADRAGGWPRLHRAMADADGAIPEPELPAAAGRSTHGEPLGPAVVSVSHERELAFPCDPRLFRHCKQRGAVRARVRARVQDCSDVATAR